MHVTKQSDIHSSARHHGIREEMATQDRRHRLLQISRNYAGKQNAQKSISVATETRHDLAKRLRQFHRKSAEQKKIRTSDKDSEKAKQGAGALEEATKPTKIFRGVCQRIGIRSVDSRKLVPRLFQAAERKGRFFFHQEEVFGIIQSSDSTDFFRTRFLQRLAPLSPNQPEKDISTFTRGQMIYLGQLSDFLFNQSVTPTKRLLQSQGRSGRTVVYIDRTERTDSPK